MDDGAFDKNFTWYEWGFVSPDDVPNDDLRVPAESTGRWHTASRLLDQWDEDHRWQT